MSLDNFKSQKCFLCYSNSAQKWPQINSSVIVPCLKYIPSDIRQTVDLNLMGQIDSIIRFCEICNQNFEKLSKLSFDVEEIQRKINNLVECIVSHVRKERAKNGYFRSQQGPPINKSIDFPFSSDIQAAGHESKINTNWQSEYSNSNAVYNDEDYFDADCNDEADSNEGETSQTKRKDLETVESASKVTSPLKLTFSSKIQCKEQRKPKSNLHKLLDSNSGYGCSTCGKKFSRYTILQKHECGKPTVECETCGLSFSRSGVLKLHTRSHTGEKPFKCELCGFACSIKANLRTHMQSKHSKERNFECDICGKKFAYPVALNKHKVFHKEASYKCDVCGKSFKMLFQLKVHLVLHSTESARPFECDLCDKTFISPASLCTHKKRAHLGDGSYKCEICEKTLSTIESLARHQMVHTGEKPFQCSQCGSRHRTQSDLRSHEHMHEDNGNFSCEICGKTYKSSYRLKKHLVRYHAEKVQCEICGKSYDKGNLKSHIKRCHDGIKPFKCEICDKPFGDKRSFLGHVGRFCHICKIFLPKTKPEALAKHQVEVHTVRTILYPSDSKITKIKKVIPARKCQRKAARGLKYNESSSEDEMSSECVDDEDAMDDFKVKAEVKSEDEFSEIEDSDF